MKIAVVFLALVAAAQLSNSHVVPSGYGGLSYEESVEKYGSYFEKYGVPPICKTSSETGSDSETGTDSQSGSSSQSALSSAAHSSVAHSTSAHSASAHSASSHSASAHSASAHSSVAHSSVAHSASAHSASAHSASAHSASAHSASAHSASAHSASAHSASAHSASAHSASAHSASAHSASAHSASSHSSVAHSSVAHSASAHSASAHSASAQFGSDSESGSDSDSGSDTESTSVEVEGESTEYSNKKIGKVIKNAFAKLYCSLKVEDPELKPKKFLINYFKTYKTEENSLPREALKKKLRQSLPKDDQETRKSLLSLLKNRVETFRTSLDIDSDSIVSKKEFLEYFLPGLKVDNVCQSESDTESTSVEVEGESTEYNAKKTGKVIKNAFAKLYCSLKVEDPELKPKKFLINYFKTYKTEENSLPREALKKKLRQSLPNDDQETRKSLLSLKKNRVETFRTSLDTDSDSIVSKKEFVEYFLPGLKVDNVCQSESDTESTSVEVEGESTEYNAKKTGKVIKNAFAKLYCSLKVEDPELKPKKFLINYFKTYKTEENSLPRNALKKELRQSLPNDDQETRKSLLSLEKSSVASFRTSLDTDCDSIVSKKEFVEYFLPGLKIDSVCE